MLESVGTLKLSGVDVTADQEILLADIGNLVFMPALNENGPAYDSFDFKVHDGTEYSSAAYTITIDVAEFNEPPTASDNTVTIDEDAVHTFTAAEFNFSDVDIGDTLNRVKITTLESAGSLKLNGSDVLLDDVILVGDINAGKLTFTPAQDANGVGYDNFDFKVHDGVQYSTASHTMTIDVTAVNDAPTAAGNTVTTNEDTGYTFTASEFGFSDVDAGDTDQ